MDSPTGLRPRLLLHGETTWEEAKEKETNILHELSYNAQRVKFFKHLSQHIHVIKDLTAHHLGLSSTEEIHVADQEDWVHGSFNACILIHIGGHNVGGRKRRPLKQSVIRFPLPYRIGEDPRPGNSDEKVLCEAGTYAWIEQNCATVLIPRLYGLGLSNGETVTLLDNLPTLIRAEERLRRSVLPMSGYPVPSQYFPHPRKAEPCSLRIPYLLIEYIDLSRGKMLSETWKEGRHDPELRSNFFHSSSRVILALARTPLPKIGSFTLDGDGYLSLSNRPLTMQIQQLENEHIPVDIPRNLTHASVDAYIRDILAFHESRLRHQPNAIIDIPDGAYQTSALAVMRSVCSCLFRREFSRGPCFLNLTDLSHSNMFVDGNGNIAWLVDLEWACSHPIVMIQPPFWLTDQVIDDIKPEEYESIHAELMKAFAEQESKCKSDYPVSFHSVLQLQQGWERGTFWCALALRSPSAMFSIFYDHIKLKFAKSHHDKPTFWEFAMPYWTFHTYSFIEKRVKDKEQYVVSLRGAFQA